jgi:hypothetical protein
VNRIFEVTDMLLTPEEVFELETAAKPLMNWLAKTCRMWQPLWIASEQS